jgi:hypothetical protein
VNSHQKSSIRRDRKPRMNTDETRMFNRKILFSATEVTYIRANLGPQFLCKLFDHLRVDLIVDFPL